MSTFSGIPIAMKSISSTMKNRVLLSSNCHQVRLIASSSSSNPAKKSPSLKRLFDHLKLIPPYFSCKYYAAQVIIWLHLQAGIGRAFHEKNLAWIYSIPDTNGHFVSCQSNDQSNFQKLRTGCILLVPAKESDILTYHKKAASTDLGSQCLAVVSSKYYY